MPGGSGRSRVFPNEYKSAIPIDLRPDTPFTSPPLNDDFDAITTQRWSKTTRATTVDPAASGLFDHMEATTRGTTSIAAFTKPERRKKGTRGDADDHRRQTGEFGVGQDRRLKRMRGKDRIKASSANGRIRMAPQAGQDYEMVEHKVLEEGPERTVSISTWREQAIQDADSDDDMSVFYVNPDDCAESTKPLGPVVEIVSLSRRPEANVASGSGSNNSGRRSKEGGEGSEERRRAQNPSPKGLTSFDGAANTSPQNRGTNLKTYRSASNAASGSRDSSAPRTSTPRGSGTLVQPLDPPPVDKGAYPFHAKKSTSGSTISSIHLPSPTLEHILGSCKPSLVHISPVLERVGIMGADHLRAVGKLSEDTRNKEVREEVLKLGVTVMEWAILLDKLKSL
ncbi:hypothetical protein DFH06DRAFT_1447900 [Mycena polygramma]|nr:hypothetical protein DFH06DRAFT_1447900 [Mycena polygramma]